MENSLSITNTWFPEVKKPSINHKLATQEQLKDQMWSKHQGKENINDYNPTS